MLNHDLIFEIEQYSRAETAAFAVTDPKTKR